MEKSLLEVKNLSKNYTHKKSIFGKSRIIKAVNDVSFSVLFNESLGIIGESGCGKTTIANTVLGLQRPSAGKVFYEGEDITNLSEAKMRKYRKDIQIIFQQSNTVLDPKMTIEELLEEPLLLHDIADRNSVDSEIDKLLRMVGILPAEKHKFPSQMSGGQIQRIIIARAIATRPKIIVCDEPVSSLDVSVQGQILNLLQKLKEELKLTYVFISHDIKVVKFICEKIAVMYRGKIVETGKTADILNNPQDEYTKALLSANLL